MRFTLTAALAAGIVFLVLVVAVDRVQSLVHFHRHFGRTPDHRTLSTWLEESGTAADMSILSAVQTYVPRRFQSLHDGFWLPVNVEQFLFAERVFPAVFVEDEHYFNNFFAKALQDKGITDPAQLKLLAAGRELYRRLETGQTPPYIAACFGREDADTNNVLPDFHHPIRIYANRISYGPDLGQPASVVILDGGKEVKLAGSSAFGTAGVEKGVIELRWQHPVVVSAVHLGMYGPVKQPAHASWAASGGDRLERDFSVPVLRYHQGLPTEQFLFFDEPVECSSLQISQAGGSFDLASIRALKVIPAAPLGINPTRSFFDITGDAGADWGKVVNWRPAAESEGLEVKPGAPLQFVLRSLKRQTAVKELLLVFAGSPATASAGCRLKYADGSEDSLPARLWRSSTPAVSWLSVTPRREQAVLECACRVEASGGDGAAARLIQVGTHLAPLPDDR